MLSSLVRECSHIIWAPDRCQNTSCSTVNNSTRWCKIRKFNLMVWCAVLRCVRLLSIRVMSCHFHFRFLFFLYFVSRVFIPHFICYHFMSAHLHSNRPTARSLIQQRDPWSMVCAHSGRLLAYLHWLVSALCVHHIFQLICLREHNINNFEWYKIQCGTGTGTGTGNMGSIWWVRTLPVWCDVMRTIFQKHLVECDDVKTAAASVRILSATRHIFTIRIANEE